MGVRGVRRRNAEQQIHAQLKDATEALLAVVKILNDRSITQLNEESLSLLAAAERRTQMIRERITVSALEASASEKGEVNG